MRILLIGMHYAPEESGNAPYTTGFAEYLAASGHEVHVVAGVPHYPSWRPRKASSGLYNGVHVHRRWHFVPRSQSAPNRALYEGTFMLTGASLVGLPRPDLVLAIVPSLSDGILARIASRRFGVPYRVVFQDLMGLGAAESGIRGGRRVEHMVRRAECWIANDAESVGIIAEGMRPYLEACGVAPGRIQRLRNWNQIPPACEERAMTRAAAGWGEGEFVCLHAGNMGHKQGLEGILDTAAIARLSEPSMRFVLAGDGNRRRELETMVSERDLWNVSFMPTLGSQEYSNVLAAADVLLLCQRPGMKNMAFPGKITSYVFSQTPIAAAVDPDSDAAQELKLANAALMVDAGDSESLLATIRRIRDDNQLAANLTQAAREYGRQHLTAEAALQQWQAFALGLRETAGGEGALLQEAA